MTFEWPVVDTVEINGVRLGCRQAGPPSGAPVVLLHGTGSGSSTWSGYAPRLVAEGHRVVAVDLRGHAASARSRSYPLGSLRDDLLGLLRMLDLRDAVVIGHSVGGHAAVAAALRAPDRIARLVLEDPAAPPRRPLSRPSGAVRPSGAAGSSGVVRSSGAAGSSGVVRSPDVVRSSGAAGSSGVVRPSDAACLPGVVRSSGAMRAYGAMDSPAGAWSSDEMRPPFAVSRSSLASRPSAGSWPFLQAWSSSGARFALARCSAAARSAGASPRRSAPAAGNPFRLLADAAGILTARRDFDLIAMASIFLQLSLPDPAWWARLREVRQPTLVLSGGPSSCIPPRRLADMTAELPDARLATIPVGHRVHSLAPDEFAAEVGAFLSRTDPVLSAS